MPTQDLPYFLENKEWYTFNEEEWKYELTDKAPQEAIDSYNHFYDILNHKTKENEEQSQAMSLFGLQGGNQNGMQQ